MNIPNTELTRWISLFFENIWMIKEGTLYLQVYPVVSLIRVMTRAVSEIKHAPCTRCAHFQGRVHDFQRCAPDCAHFFSHLSLLHIKRVHGEVPGCIVSWGVHPVGAQSKSLISDTARVRTQITEKINLKAVWKEFWKSGQTFNYHTKQTNHKPNAP